MRRDDDTIKGLGFVALYAAYVEESIDIVMDRLAPIREVTNRERKLPTSKKIAWCQDVLRSLGDAELDELIALLEDAGGLLERRNAVIHGRIYGGNDRSETLKSGRQGVLDRQITADELYDLAEELFDSQAALPAVGYYATCRALANVR